MKIKSKRTNKAICGRRNRCHARITEQPGIIRIKGNMSDEEAKKIAKDLLANIYTPSFKLPLILHDDFRVTYTKPIRLKQPRFL